MGGVYQESASGEADEGRGAAGGFKSGCRAFPRQQGGEKSPPDADPISCLTIPIGGFMRGR